MKKLLLVIATLIPFLAIGALVWAYFWYFHSQKLTPDELKELTPDYTPVTQGNWSPWHTDSSGALTWNPTASFNAYLDTVPEEDKAWPVLVDLTLSHQALFDHEDLGQYPANAQDWDGLVSLLQTSESTQVITQLLEAFDRPILGSGMYSSTGIYEHQARLKNGIEDDAWDPNPNLNPMLMDIKIPHLGSARQAINLLMSASIIELTNNNPDRFIELIEAMYSCARLANQEQVILSQLVEIACKSVTNNAILWSLEEYPSVFSKDHLERLATLAHSSGIHTLVWEGESIFFRDTIRHMTGPSGKIDPALIGVIDSNGSIPTVPSTLPDAQLDVSLQRLIYTHTHIMHHAHQRSLVPMDASLESAEDIYEQEKRKLNELGRLFMGILLPSLDKATARFQSSAQETIGVQTLIALHRHKLRHAEFPPTLNDIDHDLISHEPMDIFTGDQLQYQINDQGLLLYALGNDRDDDDGRYHKLVFSVDTPVDADWPMYSRFRLNELYPDDSD